MAVIGIGRLGGAMAATISRVGFDLLILFNRHVSAAECVGEALGAPAATSAGPGGGW